MTPSEMKRFFIEIGFKYEFLPQGDSKFKFIIWRQEGDIPVEGTIIWGNEGLLPKEKGLIFMKSLISLYKTYNGLMEE